MSQYCNIFELDKKVLSDIAIQSGFMEESASNGSYSKPWSRQKSKHRRNRKRTDQYVWKKKRNHKNNGNHDSDVNQLRFFPEEEELEEAWEAMEGVSAI